MTRDYDRARLARQRWAKACIDEENLMRKIAELRRQLESAEAKRKKATRDIADNDRAFRAFPDSTCDRVAREIPKPVFATEAETAAYYRVR